MVNRAAAVVIIHGLEHERTYEVLQDVIVITRFALR